MTPRQRTQRRRLLLRRNPLGKDMLSYAELRALPWSGRKHRRMARVLRPLIAAMNAIIIREHESAAKRVDSLDLLISGALAHERNVAIRSPCSPLSPELVQSIVDRAEQRMGKRIVTIPTPSPQP